MNNQYESFVNCLGCGKLVPIILKSDAETSSFAGFMDALLDVGKTERFEGESKCDCGAVLFATLNITNVKNLKSARGGV